MQELLNQIPNAVMTEPLCPVFGDCGGCAYQHVDYAYELEIKREKLKQLFDQSLGMDAVIDPVVASPKPYHYRHRLDLTMRRTREGFILGFQSAGQRRVIPIESCAISREEVSNFIPELKEQAIKRWPEKYRNANVVVRTCDDRRVVWGGIGRRSLELPEADYLWTEIHGKKIFYSLDTFFQANLWILPELMNRLTALAGMNKETLFLDLYAGVGLFGIYFANQAGEVKMIEDCMSSVKVMKYNAAFHQMDPSSVFPGKVEEVLPALLNNGARPHYEGKNARVVALVDPPRKGLHPAALETLSEAKKIDRLFYLSCGPEALVRDLKTFLEKGWKIRKVLPFDFFPRTVHLETLVLLEHD